MLSSPHSERHRPRVGVDFHTFDGIYQGSRSHLIGLYREAVQLAPDIDFVMLLDEPDALLRAYPEFSSPNVQTVRMRSLPGPLRLGVQLGWHQLRQRLDLLHVQHRLPFVPLGACACTIHDVLFETHPQFFSSSLVTMSRMTSRAAVSHAELLFTVSRYSRQALSDAYRIDPATIAVTYNAVDSARFRPYPVADELCARYGLVPQGYLCTVGRLEPRKNHQALVRAYAALAEPLRSYPLVIIGQRDGEVEPLQRLIKSLRLGDSVRFIDSVDDDDLPVLLSQAALFVFPSWAEGFGMPILEALACGVPVIASATTAMPEVAGQTARWVEPDDIEALTRAIEADLTMPAGERSQRIANGLRQAARFDWKRSARTLVDHFRQFLMRGRFEL